MAQAVQESPAPAAGAGELFSRHPANPLLSPADWPYPITAVSNPAAALVDGETVLLCRVDDRRGVSHLTVARSHDGTGGWRIDSAPLLSGDPADQMSAWGVQDPRVTWVDELGCWLIAYTACGPQGPCTALATTHDFRRAERIGVAVPPDDRDGCPLGRHIDGQFVLLHQPTSPMAGRADIWLSRSADLRCWSRPAAVLCARGGTTWDSARVGMGPPPLETPHGWLGIYRGVQELPGGPVCRIGLVLLHRDRPERVLRRSRDWVLAPQAMYERAGDIPNTIYPSGLIHDELTGQLRLYYGAAGTVVALATARFADVVDYLLACPANDEVGQAQA